MLKKAKQLGCLPNAQLPNDEELADAILDELQIFRPSNKVRHRHRCVLLFFTSSSILVFLIHGTFGWILFLITYVLATPGLEPTPLFTQILAIAISLELPCIFQSFQSNIRVNFVILTY